MVTESKIKVRYVETDQMGIAHHSNYYAWFEIGRCNYMATCGITYKSIEEQGILLPLIESSCRYIHRAEFEDVLIIKTMLKELNGVKAIFNYEVIREVDQKLIAKGSTSHAFINRDFKLVNIKKKCKKIWEVFLNNYQD